MCEIITMSLGTINIQYRPIVERSAARDKRALRFPVYFDQSPRRSDDRGEHEIKSSNVETLQ
jgi:hypothetical protein